MLSITSDFNLKYQAKFKPILYSLSANNDYTHFESFLLVFM